MFSQDRLRKIRIVLIDDDPAEATLLKRYLDDMDDLFCELVAFDEPLEGLASIANRRPDIVFLDHLIGDDLGLELIHKVREVGHRGPIIFLTGRGDEDIAVQAWKAGVDDYLPKRAVSQSSLKRAIVNSLEKYELRRAIERHRERLEEANRNLERKNREIETFYHAVSHELKTPLMSAREFVAIVVDGVAGRVTDEQKQYLELALDGCDQMAYYINDLLDTTRLETGKLKLSLEEFSLNRALRDAVEMALPAARRKNLTLTAELDSEDWLLRADPFRIKQVVSNLLNNAIKFTPDGGSITVSLTRSAADRAVHEVAVTDTGRGVPLEHRERIFERLYQITSGDSSFESGLGLGLSICRSIVEMHGGTIHVESPQTGGSRFVVRIPAGVETDALSNRVEKEALI